MLVSSLPPDHRPFRCSAHDRAPVLDAVRRLNGNRLDAAGIDGEVVMEGRLIKVAMDRAEVGEIGPATSQRIQSSASGRLGRYAAQRSNECSNDSDLGGVRHILILEI